MRLEATADCSVVLAERAELAGHLESTRPNVLFRSDAEIVQTDAFAVNTAGNGNPTAA
jgi:hypothetical protein